jgi:DNA repair photolyase
LNCAVVILSVTTLDPELSRRMEPQAAAPNRRLDALRELSAAGVPVGVMVAPVVPGLTDHEMPDILKAAVDAGAQFAGYVPVRLPFGVAGMFEQWLATHYPDRKDKVLNRIRSLRGGKLNDPDFGTRMRGEGEWADQLKSMFNMAKKVSGMKDNFPDLSTSHFRRPFQQQTLWG